MSSIAHLPDEARTTSAPGSKPPLGRGGEVGQRALRVLMNFPVVSVRLCALSSGLGLVHAEVGQILLKCDVFKR